MNALPFVKMEGAGNDYVYVDAIRHAFPWPRAAELARRWSDRHFGIGADGLIVLSRDDDGALRMSMWNGDGSRGAMCGNGLRCIAKLAVDHGHAGVGRMTIRTDGGERVAIHLGGCGEDPAAATIRTEMGVVHVGSARTIDVGGRAVEYVPGDAGNPHAVVFVADVECADVHGLGAAMQTHPDFPDGVNVEFVRVVAPDRIRQRTFERGSGETLACGTGAAAVSAVARQLGRVIGDKISVELRGGVLTVLLGGSSLAIEGSARTVFEGVIRLDGGPGVPASNL
ncbi:MAG: hypothetical protein RL398_2337 [Planctomycetota bacterium]|jgi:diaminopimelate epimerase